MNQRQSTEFEQRVYQALCEIPAGKVTTYKLLAQRLGCGSAQAVGQALKRNPNAPEVPCHRVINAQLSIAGYMGAVEGEAVERKRALLAAESVFFDAHGKLQNAPQYLHEWGISEKSAE